MNTIRIETDGAGDLGRFFLWLTRHRGQIVELDATKRLALGNPISGARAVIVAAVLQDDQRPGPQLGGVLRAISNRTVEEPVRLVFEGRSPAGLARDDAESVAAELLDRVNEQIASEELIARVA
jgi:hypothetical protein